MSRYSIECLDGLGIEVAEGEDQSGQSAYKDAIS